MGISNRLLNTKYPTGYGNAWSKMLQAYCTLLINSRQKVISKFITSFFLFCEVQLLNIQCYTASLVNVEREETMNVLS